ncbi:MAG: DUF962 domain-containing protein [Terracidiphilus sp.]|jgi:uncharacterized membrane protein YGL010W
MHQIGTRRRTVLGNRSWDHWIRQYSNSHQDPVNRVCHTVGIPMIALGVLVTPLILWHTRFWMLAVGLFVVGWIFQFIGHAFEGKPPEFFQDWRFLFVGLRWWFAKMTGKA